jgi:BirA family biotin operon repressor/biotin-[acetyl-CoA-carboxylase] ligase
VVLLDNIHSTNDWLMQQLASGISSGTVCLAEQQSAGRGTRGRQWVSPYGKNLYLSLYWHFENGPLELGGLSLAIAAVIARALANSGIEDIRIKWPNDLYTAGKKLGGILLDMSAEVNGPSQVVVGIGLNVDMPEEHKHSIDQEVTDLREAGLPATFDRNQLAALIIKALYECCQDFAATGFAGFVEEWHKRDMVMGREVKLVCGDRIVTGKASGVNSMGALELETEAGLQTFSSGDVTLRLS